jgi:hypothetical protein
MLEQAINGIMAPLSKVDPQAAADELTKMSDTGANGNMMRGMAVEQISQNWAEQDPQADLAWLKSLGSLTTTPALNANGVPVINANNMGAMMASQAVNGAITTWASSDPDAATAYVESLGTDDPKFKQLMGEVASTRASSDPASAVTWVQSLPDDGTRTAAMGSVVTQLASSDPQQAISLVNQMTPGTDQDKALGNVITQWSQTDPSTASQSLANLPEGTALNNASESVATNWIQVDPAAAAQWINSLPTSPARDVAARAEVTALAGGNPSSAFTWGASIGNTTMQSNQLNKVVQSWSRTDPNSAAAAVQAADLPDNTRTRLMNTIQQNAPQQ